MRKNANATAQAYSRKELFCSRIGFTCGADFNRKLVYMALYQPQVVGQTRKLTFGATTLQDRAIKTKLLKMGLTPTENHLITLRNKIQEKIKKQEFISEKEFEDLALQISRKTKIE